MCLIAYRDNIGAHIPNDVIEYNRTRNPDGFGLAWRVGTDLFYQKFAPSQFEAFRTLLKQVDEQPVVYAAHWRFATHGEKSQEMSHPYPYEDKEGATNLLFHNGVIDIAAPAGKSDTWAFANRVLPHLGARWWKNSAIKWAIEEAIGWSRLLIMTNTQDIIINGRSWVTENGIRYSTSPKGYTPVAKGLAVGTGASNAYGYGGYEGGYWETKAGQSEFKPAAGSYAAIAAGTIDPKVRADLEALLEVDDDDEAVIADGLITHVGHTISITSQIDETNKDDAVTQYGTVRCLRCGTTGEFVTMDGRMFIDCKHLVDSI